MEQEEIYQVTESAADKRLRTTGKIWTPTDNELDDLTRANGLGELSQAITSSLYGLDLSGGGTPAQVNHEQYGLCFFVRPLLRLSYDNLKQDRTLMPMATKNSKSVGAYVRAMLDPLGGHICPLVDNTNAFIPILTNTVDSISGWQDPILNTFTSTPGKQESQYALGDSSNKVYKVYQLNSSHRNIRGNVLGYMFYVWQTYISRAYAGVVDPYPEFIKKNTIDYQTRIYRLVLDRTRQFVEEVICCHVAFPLSAPLGTRANFNRADVINKENDVISQTWEAQGARYFDPINVDDFNLTAGILKGDFNDPTTRASRYRRLWPKEYSLFNYHAIPQINIKTMRLEWWVSNTIYNQIWTPAIAATIKPYNLDI